MSLRLSIVIGLIMSIMNRTLLQWIRERIYRRRWLQRRVVIVGLSDMALQAVKRIASSPWARLNPIGYVDDRSMPRLLPHPNSLAHLGPVRNLAAVVEQAGIDQVWIGYPFCGEKRVGHVLYELRHLPVSVRYLIDTCAFESINASLSNIAGIHLLDIAVSPLDGLNRYIKALEDRLLALIILIVISPLMLLIATGVKLSSPGPVFYRQERIGWNNKTFMMLKFRSMRVNAEEKSGPVWAKREDDRVTRFGSFIRRTSLDELPQFINVLKGEMSIVGPRPERPCFVEVFKDKIPNYMKKHMVKAGITGWAQVNGWRGDTDLRERIAHDLYYIKNWSLWFDFYIIARTFVSGLVNKNAY